MFYHQAVTNTKTPPATKPPNSGIGSATVGEINTTRHSRRVGRTLSSLAFIILGLASNAGARSCWCTADPEATLKSAGGVYYSWGRNLLVVKREPVSTCPIGWAGATMSGPGVTESNCMDGTNGTGCFFPSDNEASNVPDGNAVYTFTCSRSEWSDAEEDFILIKDFDSISLVIDNTPPVIAFTSAPPDGSTLPYASFRIQGTIDDASPIVSIQANGVQISTNGSQWFVEFATAGEAGSPPNNTILIPSSGRLEFSLQAIDIVGNLIAGSTETQLAGTTNWFVDPTLSRFWNFDGVPPVMTFDDGIAGVQTLIPTIAGTVTDDSGISRVVLKIREESSGYYWDGAAFSPGETELAASLQGTEWQYPGFTADDMKLGSSYTLVGESLDFFQNKTQIQIDSTLTPIFQQTLVDIDLTPANPVVFFLEELTLSYGNRLGVEVCAGVLNSLDRNKLSFVSASIGNLDVSATQDPFCGPSALLVRVASDPSRHNCIPETAVLAIYGGQIIARMRVVLLSPNDRSAFFTGVTNTILNPTTSCGAGIKAPCIFSEFEVRAWGHESMRLDMTHEDFRETISWNTRISGMPICPIRQGGKAPARAFETSGQVGNRVYYGVYDANGLSDVRSLPTNCGYDVFQNVHYGKCLVGGAARLTHIFDAAGNLRVTRSDLDAQSPPIP